MKICSNNHLVIFNKDRFCRKCGADLKELPHCCFCSTQFGENDQYCGNCGRPREEALEPKPQSPNRYKCTNCGISGVRLWRWHDWEGEPTRPDDPVREQRFCINCATEHESRRDAHSLQYREVHHMIGNFIPAIPRLHGNSFYIYDEIPNDFLNWWLSLPLHAPQKE